MDVISMHQSGIENVVASGGTALTKPQIRLIQRFTSNITVLYDGDAAGIHAALRGIDMFLEEGFNVKVVLLPDGEDPDSYAQNHDSTEFIQYIKDHQTDFIRFKMALLSREAGNDPQKRTALVKDIAASISVIPDIIVRRNYIKECAMQLHVDEQSLMQGADILRHKKIEEEKKRREEELRHIDSVGDNGASGENEETQDDVLSNIQFLDQIASNKLEQNYYNLMQLVVRYGERPIDIDGTIYTIGEVIIYTLEGDEILPMKPVYQTIIDEFKRHCKDEGFKAEQFFKFHPDPQVSATAIDMIVEKYQFAKADKDIKLGELVTRLLYEIKLTVINMQIEELEAGLKQAQADNNWDRQIQLLAHQPKLLEQRNEICKLLGNRVINI